MRTFDGGKRILIKVKNLTKKYGNHLAVDNISFEIERGRIYGFLGPNGAGKSTTMNILTGCLSATSGSVLIDGHDIFEDDIEAKRHIGYLPELPPLYMDMTPREFLLFVAEAKGVPYEKSLRQVKEAMKLTQIDDVQNRLIRTLSKGYRQRVGIAQAMLGDPDVIILDEPTVGLDPSQIIEIRNLIKGLGETKTVIISSHILSEIQAVCDHVLIISKGRIVANDSLASLEERAQKNGGLTVIVKCNVASARAVVEKMEKVESAEYSEGDGVVQIVIHSVDNEDIRDELFFAFADERVAVLESSYRKASLENIFLELTGEEAGVIPGLAEVDAPPEDERVEDEDGGEIVEDEGDDDDYKPLFSSNDEDEEDE